MLFHSSMWRLVQNSLLTESMTAIVPAGLTTSAIAVPSTCGPRLPLPSQAEVEPSQVLSWLMP